MNKQALFHFTVAKEDRSITVERFFGAPVDLVWSAWTDPAILCQWWAPKPYACMITSLDLRAGGRWSYYMQGPEGDRHHCFFDFETVVPKSSFSGTDGFCDEQGVINTAMPRMKWESHFSPAEGGTLVRIVIRFEAAEDLEKIIGMGFKEGFTQGLEQLEELLAHPIA
ncbi:MAG TPA: SRPBCC domain-containing protein [Flavobacteriales bacterium]|nr:SRPBCC domain-containing protein [Flavobacteriales bacterium]HMR26847.1 SRPBCC domain-containing protein [Flavobacteriales bacterium]